MSALVAVLLCACATAYAASDTTRSCPPRATLLHIQQTKGPESDYLVVGFPGCAVPGAELSAVFADGAIQPLGTVGDDGAFQHRLDHRTTAAGLSLTVLEPGMAPSPTVAIPLDYPTWVPQAD